LCAFVLPQLGVAVFSSRPIHQGIADMSLKSLLESAPEMDKKIPTHGSRLLQIARSTPGIQTCLAGQKSMSHVQENLELSSVPPLSIAEFKTLMGRFS
jgi:aryl-alcohol dehydrogenase-like predicted oxidoreductase